MRETSKPSDRLITLPNGMTAFRAVLGVVMPFYMRRGGRHATIIAGLGALSDKEKPVADWIDRRWPESGRGCTKFGKRADFIADPIFGAGMAVGVLVSPRTSRTAKASAALTLIKVGLQTRWAISANRECKQVTGKPYTANVDMVGKTATACMLAATSAATLTCDLNPDSPRQQRMRRTAGVVAVGLSAAGLLLGEAARRRHDRTLHDQLAQYPTTPPPGKAL